ncbi:hypothetical protein C8A00DRAFT_38843 [Chaetomidium leptoderma]|uniref:Uncharacterized protein n=1 Tax=Chaetomidium leptoderma TaxID=669021 RepID=A0AAN6VBV0_9PEZI|nr:hypothetical protein C8A00DRAFT_38843 [Chaetomidium leptoderma]
MTPIQVRNIYTRGIRVFPVDHPAAEQCSLFRDMLKDFDDNVLNKQVIHLDIKIKDETLATIIKAMEDQAKRHLAEAARGLLPGAPTSSTHNTYGASLFEILVGCDYLDFPPLYNAACQFVAGRMRNLDREGLVDALGLRDRFDAIRCKALEEEAAWFGFCSRPDDYSDDSDGCPDGSNGPPTTWKFRTFADLPPTIQTDIFRYMVRVAATRRGGGLPPVVKAYVFTNYARPSSHEQSASPRYARGGSKLSVYLDPSTTKRHPLERFLYLCEASRSVAIPELALFVQVNHTIDEIPFLHLSRERDPGILSLEPSQQSPLFDGALPEFILSTTCNLSYQVDATDLLAVLSRTFGPSVRRINVFSQLQSAIVPDFWIQLPRTGRLAVWSMFSPGVSFEEVGLYLFPDLPRLPGSEGVKRPGEVGEFPQSSARAFDPPGAGRWEEGVRYFSRGQSVSVNAFLRERLMEPAHSGWHLDGWLGHTLGGVAEVAKEHFPHLEYISLLYRLS